MIFCFQPKAWIVLAFFGFYLFYFFSVCVYMNLSWVYTIKPRVYLSSLIPCTCIAVSTRFVHPVSARSVQPVSTQSVRLASCTVVVVIILHVALFFHAAPFRIPSFLFYLADASDFSWDLYYRGVSFVWWPWLTDVGQREPVGVFMVWSFFASFMIDDNHVWGSLHGCQGLLGLVVVNKVIRNDFQANVWRDGLSDWK